MVIFLAFWTITVVAAALAATHWWTTRTERIRRRALESIVREKGETVKPGEPIRAALLRARRRERESRPPAPMPSFARSLQRPKSRPSWTNEVHMTQHRDGRTVGSDPSPPPSLRLRPTKR